ncbi:MAG: metal-dependent hydrolase [Vicinamibacterales bacterium]
MASLGHLAVGLVAARHAPPATTAVRASAGAAVFWSALSFLPDADVIGFGFGIRYGDEWGHRGASHSFAFALLLGAAIGALAPLFRRPALRTGLTAALVLASHPLLDIFTNGGLGCALFWPIDLTRYFAPWTPIPVSPIGLGYLSPYGLFVAVSELAIFSPLFWWGLRRPGPP